MSSPVSLALPYLDRTLFGIIAAFVPDTEFPGTYEITQPFWSSLAGEFGYFTMKTWKEDGAVETRRNGVLHSWDDKPSLDTPNCLDWHQNGKLHRDKDLPAAIWKRDGSQSWYQHNELHRDGDEPAEIDGNGDKTWYQYGQIHRDGDLPAEIKAGGRYKAWYDHGRLHRDGDLPAMIQINGDQHWYRYGQRHRGGDLPAIILRANGARYWFRYGVQQKQPSHSS